MKASDRAIKVLVGWVEMSNKVSELSDEDLVSLGREFTDELPLNSPVLALVDELCERVEERGKLESACRIALTGYRNLLEIGILPRGYRQDTEAMARKLEEALAALEEAE